MLKYYRKTFLKLFEQVALLREAQYAQSLLCLDIQETLISKTRYVEGKIRHCKRAAQANEANDDGEYWWQKTQDYRDVLSLFRKVGDSLAFIYIDTWDIKPMANNHTPGFISGKSGFELESRLMRYANRKGLPCLLSDLTSVLRHGDLYGFQEGIRPLVLEVKSGRLNSRGKRQRRRFKQLFEYLDTDRTSTLFGDGKVFMRVALSKSISYHTDQLREVIDIARRDGFCFRRVEEGLYYIAATNDDFDRMAPRLEPMNRPIAYPLNADKFETNTFPYTPLILSIRDPDSILDFYEGCLCLFVVVDLDVVLGRLTSGGLQVKISDDEYWMFEISGKRGPFMVSRPLFDRVCYEFLSLNWLISHIKELMTFDPETVAAVEDV